MTGTAVAAFSADDFRARARARLSPVPSATAFDSAILPDHGDYRLNAADMDADLLARARPAAVLVPAVARPHGVSLILTERTAHLRAHSGQVAFPGGKIDASDASPAAAALREAQEEIGLDPAGVETIGYLDPYITTSGYRILPVVGVVAPEAAYAANPEEVARVFEAPLSFLMEPANHQRGSRLWEGRERFFYVMPYGEHYIWGVTAGIIRALYERLYR